MVAYPSWLTWDMTDPNIASQIVIPTNVTLELSIFKNTGGAPVTHSADGDTLQLEELAGALNGDSDVFPYGQFGADPVGAAVNPVNMTTGLYTYGAYSTAPSFEEPRQIRVPVTAP